MPIYSIQNVDTDEIFDVNLKYAELIEYLHEHSNLKQIFTKFPGVVDSARIGVRKVDDNFKDVLKKAKESHRGSNINTF